jgi:xanthine/CO dehydrogenase XdhC/CoxF family maturation factor
VKGLLEILATLESLQEPAALATLVRVKGSSYRKPGARMVYRPEGGQTGVLSAGCLETDVKARVASVLASREPQVAVFDMGSDLDLIWGTGMGCQGRADVLLEAVNPGAPAPWMTLCARMLTTRGMGAMATVFAARGETPDARVGDRFILDSAGPGLLPAPGPFAQALDLAMRQPAAGAVTLPSGAGELDLLLEPILPPYALWIFGAGEHARPLTRLAKALGWWVGLLDHRPALATAERFPEADRIVLGHPPESFQGLPFDRRSAALVVSHVYEQDRLALAALLEQPLGYLGLQGNRARSARILKELQEAGLVLTPARQELLHVPAGLDLGAESPEVIALSMLAEVQAALSGHPAGSLRDRSGSIHRPPPPPGNPLPAPSGD